MVDILLVENNGFFRQMLKQNLEKYFPQISVEEAEDSREAFYKIGNFTPKLLLVDIHLTGELGFGLIEKVKKRYPEVTVAVLTGYDFPEYHEVAFLAGADYFLNKNSAFWRTISDLIEKIFPNKNHPE
jgi:CheY-like chemotaxis protein